MFIELEPTHKQVLQATKMGLEMGTLKNSISKGQGNQAGFIGELVVGDYLGAEQTNTYEYDLILPNGKTIDVKTKRCNTEPRAEYDASISSYNTKQQCDYYVFTRILHDYSVLWIAGYMEKELYFNQAVERKKGERDPTNGFLFRSSCWNLPYGDLKDIKELAK